MRTLLRNGGSPQVRLVLYTSHQIDPPPPPSFVRQGIHPAAPYTDPIRCPGCRPNASTQLLQGIPTSVREFTFIQCRPNSSTVGSTQSVRLSPPPPCQLEEEAVHACNTCCDKHSECTVPPPLAPYLLSSIPSTSQHSTRRCAVTRLCVWGSSRGYSRD
jgi:hypothetical protein